MGGGRKWVVLSQGEDPLEVKPFTLPETNSKKQFENRPKTPKRKPDRLPGASYKPWRVRI